MPRNVFLLLVLAFVSACGGSDGDGEPSGGSGGSTAGSGGSAGSSAGAGGSASGGTGAGGSGGGSTACAALPGTPGAHEVTLTSGGRDRVSRVHVPPGYDGNATMLVIALHGWTQNGARLEEISELSQASDAHGFIVAYPEGLSQSWNAGRCCGAAGEGVDDVLFARDLVARIQTEWCVDPRRIHATGFSNGAMMSHRIGCEAADLFAAIAPVSGQIGVTSCSPSRPIPVWSVQGTSDLILQFNGLGSFADTMAGWVERNGCTDPQPAQVFQNGAATCNAYTACAGGSEVVACEIGGHGHQWAGGVSTGAVGGSLSNDLDASEQLYEFFAAHPL